MKTRLVLINWEDSAQPTPAWQYLIDYEPPAAIKCTSVGWLIEDGKGVKVLAPNMAGLEARENLQVSGMITIPTRSVTRIVSLKEGK